MCITFIHFIGDPDACVASTQPSKQVYMTRDEPRAAVHTVSLKLPPFWQEDPALWFHQMEAQFAIKGITQQLTKYHYIVGSLAPEIAREGEVSSCCSFWHLERPCLTHLPHRVPEDAKTALSRATGRPETLTAPSTNRAASRQNLQWRPNPSRDIPHSPLSGSPACLEIKPQVQTNSLPLLTASLQSPQKPLYLDPSATLHLSLLILTLCLSPLWAGRHVNSPCSRKLAIFTSLYHLPFRHTLLVPCPIWQGCHQMQKKNLSLCRETLFPPTDGDQWIGK